MRKFTLIIIVLIQSIVGKGESFDSIKLKLERIPIAEQLKVINSLSFDMVVENNRAIIPLLKQYEELTYHRKEFTTLAKIYMNLSLAYYFKGEYDQNLMYGLNAINLLDSLGDRSLLGTMYGELGYQMKYRDLAKAFCLMKKGIIELERIGNPEPLAKIYDNYGVLYEIGDQIDSAIYFYKKSLTIKKSRNDSLGIPYSLNNFFMAYLLSSKFDSAYKYLDESTKMRLKRNDDMGLAENFGYYSQLYSAKAEYKKAIEFNFLSLDKSKKYGYTNLIKSNYKDLSANYEKLHDYENALKYHKLFSTYQDSLINLETNKTLADLQIQYETAEKEKELIKKTNQLNQQNTIKISIIVVACILILSTLIYFRSKMQIVKRNEKIKIQNALIEGEQAERNRLAMELHDGIASELSGIIMHFRNTTDTKDFEADINEGIEKLNQTHQVVRKLSHTLMPQSLKDKGLRIAIAELANNFGSETLKINTQLGVIDKKLTSYIEFNIYRIVQEALNNIIRHSKASKVLIDFNIIDNTLSLNIEDNGIGFSTSSLGNINGIGIQNIVNRTKMMNGKISINSNIGEGTSIEIQVPLK